MENFEEIIKRIDNEIENTNNRNVNVFFYVMDTKGAPSGELVYEYQMAKAIKDAGFDVTMLYLGNSEDFVGVGSWLGQEYAEIPHKTSSEENVVVSPSDIVFIPEVFNDVMRETNNVLPCRRIALIYNYDYIIQTVPLGETWSDYGMYEAVTTSDTLKNRILEIFPYMSINVIPPYIDECFYQQEEPKMLQIGLVTKYPNDAKKVVKPFMLKCPFYSWLTFVDLRGLSREEFANNLRTTPIIVNIDEESNFGMSALEALKCGCILICKTPEMIPGWMLGEDGKILENIILIRDINDIHTLIAMTINSWMNDMVPKEMFEISEKVCEGFTKGIFTENVINYVNYLFDSRIEGYNQYKKEIIKKNEGKN